MPEGGFQTGLRPVGSGARKIRLSPRKEHETVEKIRQEKILNVPNALTILRFVLLPFFVWQFFRGHTTTAFIIYIVVQLTDMLDGLIARKCNLVTNFGKLMDPLADKLMLLTVLICFGIDGRVPWWIIALVLVKEAALVVGGAVALHRGIVVHAKHIGKVATVVFALSIVLNFMSMSPLDRYVLYAAVALTLSALVFYAADMLGPLREAKKPRAK